MGTWRRAKKLASLAGKIVTIEPAIGPAAQLLTRALQKDISTAVDMGGWRTKTKLAAESLESLKVLRRCIRELNGQGIRSEATAIPLQAFIGEATTKKDTHIHMQKIHSIVAGDASDVAVCS